jgi:hypothetical protein
MPTPDKPIIDAEEVARERAKKRTMPSSKSTVYGKSTMPSTKGTAYGKKTMPMPKTPGAVEEKGYPMPKKVEPTPKRAKPVPKQVSPVPKLTPKPAPKVIPERHGGGPGRVH